MLQLAWDMGLNQKNYKGAVWAMAAPIVLGGGSSIAFRSMFFGLITALMRAMGDDRDPEKMVYDGIREHFGAIGEHTARYGAVGLILNADISGSLSVDGSWPPKAQDFLGAPFALVTDTLAGLDYVRTMQPWRGLEVMAPVGVGNILRSLRETDGVTTRAGRPVFDQKGKLFTPTAAESVKRAAGFRSARVATAQSSSFESKKEKKAFAEKRATIYEIYRSYLQNKDLRKYRKVIKLMKQYNEELKKSGRDKVLPKVTKKSLERQAKAFKKQPKSERR
jgi:hypothetical protein